MSTAYEVLGDAEARPIFDEERDSFQPNQDSNAESIFRDSFDEDFAENAWDSQSEGHESESHDFDDDAELIKYTQSPPDDDIRKLYAKATPYVTAFLGNPADKSSKAQIEKINLKIEGNNQRHGVEDGDRVFCILVNSLEALSRQWQESAGQGFPETQEKLKESLEKMKRQNNYPAEWKLPTDANAEKKIAQAKWAAGIGGEETAKSSSKGKGKRREGIFSTSKGESSSAGMGEEREDTLFMPEGGSSSNGKGKEREETFPTTRRKVVGPDIPQQTSLAHKVVGGKTRDGDKILGYRPFFRTGRTGRTEVFGYQFLIERPGRDNPLELLSGAEIGNFATEAYLALPGSEKKDMRDSATKYKRTDITRFKALVGFATKGNASQTSSGRRRPGYGLVKFKDGEQDILCRTALRNVLGRTDADYEIGRYIDPTSIGELSSTTISRNKMTSRRHLRNVEQDTPETRNMPQLTVGDQKNEITEVMNMLLMMQRTQQSYQEALEVLQSRVIAREPTEL